MSRNLVSIIIRTYNRPYLLRQAIKSVENQTVQDYEIIVVEDGAPSSKFIIEEFRGLDIWYYCPNKNVGRTIAANLGLERAKGKYINFLDDDDILLPNHIETMLKGFSIKKDAFAVHTCSIERRVKYISLDPLVIDVKEEQVKFNEPLIPDQLLFENAFPIQAVMFHRVLYEKLGGMDECLDLLEDWDLWIKYSRDHSFFFMNEITSVYYIGLTKREYKKRKKVLQNYERKITSKYSRHRQLSGVKKVSKFKKLLKFYKKNGMRKTLLKILNL